MAQRLRVLGYGDHHFDQHTRFDECVRVHEWCVDLARREKVGLVLSGGDLYERASTPIERRACADHVTAITEIAPLGIAKGNHDRPLDCQLLGRLHTRQGVVVEEGAAVHAIAGAAVALVAWPERASIAASLRRRGSALDPASIDEGARVAMDALFVHLADELAGLDFDGRTPRIVCGHFMVDGAVVSTGQPLLGMPMNVGLAALASMGAPLVICGHIHRSQEWTHGGARIVYPGSPLRTDFGQLEPKHVVLATFEDARLVDVDFVETPATAMRHVAGEWTDEGALPGIALDVDPEDPRVRGAEVRLRYRVPAERRDAARAQSAELRRILLENGAASVKVEECVIPTVRARAPEIAAAPTLVGKLEALAKARGEELTDGVRAKVSKLEEEIGNAA